MAVNEALRSQRLTADQAYALANYFGNTGAAAGFQDPNSEMYKNFITRNGYGARSGSELATFLSTREAREGGNAQGSQLFQQLMQPYLNQEAQFRVGGLETIDASPESSSGVATYEMFNPVTQRWEDTGTAAQYGNSSNPYGAEMRNGQWMTQQQVGGGYEDAVYDWRPVTNQDLIGKLNQGYLPGSLSSGIMGENYSSRSDMGHAKDLGIAPKFNYTLGADGKYRLSQASHEITNRLNDDAASVAKVLSVALGAAAMGAGGAGAAGGTGAGAGGMANGAFLGEGALSGIGAWDGALAAAGTGAGSAAGFVGEGASSGIPAWDGAVGSGVAGGGAGGGSFWDTIKSAGSSLSGGGSGSSLLGTAATALGGAAGGQGTQSGGTVDRRMDPRLDAPVFGDLIPRTQGLLGAATDHGRQLGADTISRGVGLQNTPVAGNGVGQVTLGSPTTATNPYLTGMADDMQRRTQQLLGQNNLAIQGNAVGVGGLGGSRQGIAQGTAAAGAADSLQGQLAGLYGQAYNSDQNRALQKYGQDMGFYTSQRGQDLQQVGLGTDLIGAGQGMQWKPLQNATGIYSPFSGYGTSTTSEESGGGWQGALGGVLGGAKFGRDMGWW